LDKAASHDVGRRVDVVGVKRNRLAFGFHKSLAIRLTGNIRREQCVQMETKGSCVAAVELCCWIHVFFFASPDETTIPLAMQGSSMASPKLWEEPNILTLSEQKYFVWDTAS